MEDKYRTWKANLTPDEISYGLWPKNLRPIDKVWHKQYASDQMLSLARRKRLANVLLTKKKHVHLDYRAAEVAFY